MTKTCAVGWICAGLVAGLLGMAGCTPRSDGAVSVKADPAHSSRNAVDWAGTYEGVTPCSDCPGVRMRLTLQRDGRFELSTQYLDRQAVPQTARGSFAWNAGGNTITLDAVGAGRQFRVGEDRLLLLNPDGGVPSWNAPDRVLTRQLGGTSPGPGATAALAKTLQDHDWTLQSATYANGKSLESLLVAGHPFGMRFDGPRLGVQGGCNLMSGDWQLSPQDRLMVGRMAATQKACEPSLMRADAAMSEFLAQPLSARLAAGEAPTLRLESAAGKTLAFSGQRTSRSLYGAPTRIFLEVAAQRVPCTPALQPPTTCLQVRERRFDDQGLAVGEPGPWRAFYGEIAGYIHQTGVSNVLRINRYKVPNPPADGSAYVYELDLIVEAKTVEPT